MKPAGGRGPPATPEVRLLKLPELTAREFASRLARAAPAAELDGRALEVLFTHYQELRRWGAHTSLLGPREAETLFERHYAESLAALPLLPAGRANLLDLGSGAGFPGLVLAAARRDLRVTLVEPRARKWAFLSAVARRAALSCRCLDARVTGNELPELPETVDLVTARALRVDPAAFANLASKLAPDARLLLWTGQAEPEVPPRFVRGRQVELAGSAHRFLREYRQHAPT